MMIRGQKHHLVNWPAFGSSGFGIVDLEVKNVVLLSKWIWKLENEKELLQSLILRKYVRQANLTQVQFKAAQSHFLHGDLKVGDVVIGL